MRFTSFALALYLAKFAAAAVPTTNPVDLYQRAFVLMESAKDKNGSAIGDPAKAPLDDKTAVYLKQREPVLRLLCEAAKLPVAQWPASSDDLQPTLTMLTSVRPLMNLARLTARYNLKEKRFEQSADDSLVAMALARHIGQARLLLCVEVNVAYETQAIDELLAELPLLPKDVVAAFPAKLAALPSPVTGKEMMEAEFELGRKLMAKQNVPPEFFAAAEPFYRAVGAATTQPAEQFEATVDAEAMKLMLNPYVKAIAPSIKATRPRLWKLEAKRAELLQALQKAAG